MIAVEGARRAELIHYLLEYRPSWPGRHAGGRTATEPLAGMRNVVIEMRTLKIIMLICFLNTACYRTPPTQAPDPLHTLTSVPTSTPTQAVTSTPFALSQHYASSLLPIQFDDPDGWTVQEYQDEVIEYSIWILLSNQTAFFEDPLNPTNTGAFINFLSWADIVGLDAAVMTPDPPRFSKITPDPAAVANTICFYSEWTNGYCLGTGCCIDLNLGQNIFFG